MATSNPAPAPPHDQQPPGRLLTQRNFVLFWSGQTISKIGNGAYQVALGWTVYQTTGSAAAMGVLLALNLLPELLLLLVGGTLADRLPRRKVILAADSAAALTLLGLAAAASTGRLTFTLLAAAALALGLISAFYSPAYAAMNQDLLQAGQFRKANAFFTASGNLARLAGPLLAGALYAVGGATTVFAINGASFALAAAAMMLTRPAHRVALPEPQSMRRDLADGITYTKRTSWLLLILAISLVANCLCLAPYSVLLPGFVYQAGEGVGTLGLLSTVEVAAIVLSSMVIGRLGGRYAAGRSLLALAACLGMGGIALGLSNGRFSVLFVGAALVGVGLSFDIIENTLMQTLVPPHLLSRVYSVNMVFSYALLPVAYAGSGLLARHLGAPAVLLTGGAALLALCACARFHPATRHLNTVRW